MSMKIIAVDDEQLALNELVKAIKMAAGDCDIRGFIYPSAAIDCIKTQGYTPDVVFLDIQMYGMTGIELARQIKNISPTAKIIFVTAYSHYAFDAFSIHSQGYLLKPATPERIREELEYLNGNVPVSCSGSRIYVHTFGNFDVLSDGEPILFRRSKSKELLAYLVDRKGASATKKEIAAVLWDDKEYSRSNQIYFQTLFMEMMRSLKGSKAEHIVRRKYNSYSVDPSRFDCDYYDFERGDTRAVNAYHGEYMANYSWAEFTLGYLEGVKSHSGPAEK